MSRKYIQSHLTYLFSLCLICLSFSAAASSLEADILFGAQTSDPMSAQWGAGIGLNTTLATSVVGFAHTEMNLYAVEYINKKVLFKEVPLGIGTKIVFGSTLIRVVVDRVYRFYEGLNDSGYRVGTGVGTVVNRVEATINYYKYYKIEKTAVILNIAYLF